MTRYSGIGWNTGMLLAAECYLRIKGARQVVCAKLHHDAVSHCIFRCNYHSS